MPNPDGSIDTSAVAFVGDGRGRVELKVGDEPSVLLFTADQPGIREYFHPKAIANTGMKEALKFSGVARLRVNLSKVDGHLAKEDAIDINHCTDLEVSVVELYAGQTYCGTIKGGSERIALNILHQFGHGKETDWDYGNFSDQGNRKTTGCKLTVSDVDAGQVQVRVITADKPELFGAAGLAAHVSTVLSGGWFYPVFNFLKDLLRTFRIKI